MSNPVTDKPALITASVNNNPMTSFDSEYYLIAIPCVVLVMVVMVCVYCYCRKHHNRSKNSRTLKESAASQQCSDVTDPNLATTHSCHAAAPLQNSIYTQQVYSYQPQAPSSGGSVSHPSVGGYTQMMQVNSVQTPSHSNSTATGVPPPHAATPYNPNFTYTNLPQSPRHPMSTFQQTAHSLLRPVAVQAAAPSRSASRSTGIGAPLTTTSRYTTSDVSSTFSAATGHMSLLPNPPSQVYSSVVGAGSSVASS